MEFLKSLFTKPLSYDEFVATATGAGSPALPALFWRLLLLEHRAVFLLVFLAELPLHCVVTPCAKDS